MKPSDRPPRTSLSYLLLALLLAVLRRLFGIDRKGREPPSVFEEMNRGSLIGLPVCALCAWVTGSAATVVLWFGMLGIFAGALFGLLLWMESDAGPQEDPVLPPAPGQGRDPAAKPRHESR